VQHEDRPSIKQADEADLGEAGYDRAPQLSPVSDVVAAYRLVYERVETLIRGRADIAELTVPACPSWTIRQTIAHLTGVAQDVVSLNMEEKASSPWTQAQVDRLGGHSIDELLDLWGQMIDQVAELLVFAPQVSTGQLVFDTLTHEYDIRGALSEPGPRTGDLAFEVALGFLTTVGDQLNREGGLPALRLTTPTIGTVLLGDPHATRDQLALNLSDFEALRAFGGRRSIRQLLALPWQGDPTDLMPTFTHLAPAFSNGGLQPQNDDLIE
jgi:uncharacterized protein (TIGR03083 family)